MPSPVPITEYQQFAKETYSGDDLAQLNSVLSVVGSMVSSYTRGRGFTDGTPADDLKAVIMTAAARMLKNPNGIRSESMGPFMTQYDQAVFNWTLSELTVMDRYRVKAQ
ncbi:hypothetical protein [Mycobacterium shigaense]|uniref:hypothetical protein n=1 Tax=Mycobacterium shigaense TaxID=722731 RepID=UPI002AE0A693|nr:hypothetical protein [Mycobacterium shigaense]MEA1121717.1 hypothetical protein [Mycobacterium shigaense]